jgi:hypothetical protein
MGTILSISDQVAVLRVGGVTAPQALEIGSGITADGGLIELNGGTITTHGDSAFGLLVSGAGSSVTVRNSNVLSSQGLPLTIVRGVASSDRRRPR